MSRIIKKLAMTLVVAVILVISIAGIVFADDDTMEIVVSPNVLNLESNGGSISIHTDVGYVVPPGAFYLTYNDTHTTYTDDDTIQVIKVIPQKP